jgi:hypothetical protein
VIPPLLWWELFRILRDEIAKDRLSAMELARLGIYGHPVDNSTRGFGLVGRGELTIKKADRRRLDKENTIRSKSLPHHSRADAAATTIARTYRNRC